MSVKKVIILLVPVLAVGTGVYVFLRPSIGPPPVRRVLERLEERLPATTLRLPEDNPGRLALHSLPVLSELGITGLTLVAPVPGSREELFALEKAGRLYRVWRRDSGREKQLLLDLSDDLDTTQNGGLLGLAFDPAFGENRQFYLSWTAVNPNRIVVTRHALQGSGQRALAPGATRRILEIPVPKFSHVGGTVAFGLDDMLYISTGYGEVQSESQDLGSLLGKILRIDPSSASPYAIPGDNPFVGHDGARPEVWAYGLRNPWRFSFDSETGDLWVGDIGSEHFEEINLVRRGGNYGWNALEATMPREEEGGGAIPEDVIDPVVAIPSREGRAVIGGYLYRGAAMPSLRGHYIYGDYDSGRIWALKHEDGEAISNREVGFVSGLSSFSEDHDGELLAMALGGEVYRFREPETSGNLMPRTLTETGVFLDTPAMIPAPGMVEYELASMLWSDGAQKRRWIALPGDEAIEFRDSGAWGFPRGTVIVKHFDMELAPGEIQRVETRLMVHEKSGWGFYTYRWNEAQDEAYLVTEPGLVELVSARASRHNKDYHIPSTAECLRCHTPAAGYTLGVTTNQINTPIAYVDGPVNQLEEWARLGMFKGPVGPATNHEALVDPWDTTQTLEDRARSYLAGNCASCHRPGGPTRSTADMRYSTPLPEAGMLDAETFSGRKGRWLLKPGDPEKSDVYRRIESTSRRAMPPVGRLHVDPFAEDLIRRWIRRGMTEGS
jgi:uncharacterized repeat protein (TIGR03806 family)